MYDVPENMTGGPEAQRVPRGEELNMNGDDRETQRPIGRDSRFDSLIQKHIRATKQRNGRHLMGPTRESNGQTNTDIQACCYDDKDGDDA